VRRPELSEQAEPGGATVLAVKTSHARLPLYGECAWRGDLTD
jgi:hypothetical protein